MVDTLSIRRVSAKDTGKLIRRDLKAAFPKVKFSVRMSRGTGYGTYHIDWVDGPTVPQVKHLIGRYQGASYDGMTDSMVYCGPVTVQGENGPERVVYETRFLLTQRTLSPEVEAKLHSADARYWANYEALPEWEKRERMWRRFNKTEVLEDGTFLLHHDF